MIKSLIDQIYNRINNILNCKEPDQNLDILLKAYYSLLDKHSAIEDEKILNKLNKVVDS